MGEEHVNWAIIIVAVMVLLPPLLQVASMAFLYQDALFGDAKVDMKHSVYSHPRTGSLIREKQVLPFRDLPIEYQDAIIHYMSVDGAAWAVADGWPEWKWGEGKPSTLDMRAEVMADIAKFRPRFVEAYGDQKFGCCTLPHQTLIECVNGDGDGDIKHHGRYVSGQLRSTREYDTPTWPVILSEFHDETFQDGWGRFGEYCARQMDVPVTWYAD